MEENIEFMFENSIFLILGALVAFPPGDIRDAAKMGALGSFAAAPITYAAARILGIRKSRRVIKPVE